MPSQNCGIDEDLQKIPDGYMRMVVIAQIYQTTAAVACIFGVCRDFTLAVPLVSP